MGFPRAFQSYVPRTHCVSSHVYGAILITPDRETVVIRGRQSGKWSFPKGHGSSTEQPLVACIRELREETGIDLKGIKPDDELRFKVGTYFVFYIECKPPLCPEDTKEVMDCMWVPFQRLQFLVGNMDLTTFCRRVNTNQLVDKIMALRGCESCPPELLYEKF
jgi:8-oxo-dGTP pyrophosphatase MutT (NUDIX family)